MLSNNISRYHIMEAAMKGGAKRNEKVALDMTGLLGEIRHQVSKVQECIMSTGEDPGGTFDVPRFEETVFDGGAKKEGKAGGKEDGFLVN